jgi:ComF family protein
MACRNASSLYKVQAATTYTGIAKTLVWKLKFSGAQAAAKTMTSLMAGLAEAEKGSILVAVPTATSRVRQRGYDQSKLLARALSKQTGLPRLSLLGRAGQAQQHGASRQERISQLKNDFRIAPLTDVRNKHIILVDDVITTGATLESAAAILLAAGAKQVDGLIFAQTPLAIK